MRFFFLMASENFISTLTLINISLVFLAPSLEKERELDNSAYSKDTKWAIRAGISKVNCAGRLGKCVSVLQIFELIKCPTYV